VLDPFIGSCITGKVAKDMNRQYIGFEIDNAYLNKNLILQEVKCF